MAQSKPITHPTCPVAPLAGEIARAVEAFNRTDDAILDTAPQRRVELDRRRAALGDRISALEEAASHKRASSPVGALLQLMLAHDALAELDGPEAARRRVERLLRSVAGFVEASGGRAAPDALAEHYMPSWSDPFRAMGAALVGAELQ